MVQGFARSGARLTMRLGVEAIRNIQRKQGWSDSTLLFLILQLYDTDPALYAHLEEAAKHEQKASMTVKVKKSVLRVTKEEPDAFSLEDLPNPGGKR